MQTKHYPSFLVLFLSSTIITILMSLINLYCCFLSNSFVEFNKEKFSNITFFEYLAYFGAFLFLYNIMLLLYLIGLNIYNSIKNQNFKSERNLIFVFVLVLILSGINFNLSSLLD